MVSERFLSLQPIADMLYEIESTAKHGQTLRELVKDAQQLAKKYPPTTDDRKKLTELEAKRNQHLQRLADLNVGQEVEAFLVAVAHSNATLKHVTSDVLTWIDENDARALFRISARRS